VATCTYDDTTHTYFIDGIKVPSVTQVLRAGGVATEQYMDRFAADRGSAVHLACSMHLNGDLDPASLDYRLVPYVSAFKRFVAISKWQPIHTEKIVYSTQYGYAGRIDLYGKLNGHYALIDIKTGSIPAWVGVQLSAYILAGLWCEVIAGQYCKRYSLLLTNKDTFRLVESTGNDLPVFLSALEKTKGMEEWMR
jgi:hypothetical protein